MAARLLSLGNDHQSLLANTYWMWRDKYTTSLLSNKHLNKAMTSVLQVWYQIGIPVFCLGGFCRTRRPAPFWWRHALFKKPKWRPALFTKKKSLKKKYQSHMSFCSVLPFLLPTHIVDCAVHLLLGHSRGLLVNSALFLPFTVLIMPFFFSSPC